MYEALAASLCIAFISLIGVFFFGKSGRLIGSHRFVIPFAVGVFLGVVFFELIPETLEAGGEIGSFAIVGGFLAFYLLSHFLHSYHLCVFYFDKRKTKKNRSELIKFFDQNKIGFGIHYRSINDMTFYKKEYNWSKKNAPNAHYVGDNIISLPLYPHLKMKHLKYICDKIDNFFEN